MPNHKACCHGNASYQHRTSNNSQLQVEKTERIFEGMKYSISYSNPWR